MEGPFPNVYPLSSEGDDKESAPRSTPLRPNLPPILPVPHFPLVAHRSRLAFATIPYRKHGSCYLSYSLIAGETLTKKFWVLSGRTSVGGLRCDAGSTD